MIGTNERREINNIYNIWINNKEDLESNSAGMLLWLQTHGMLNEEAAEKYLEAESRKSK